MIEYGTANTEKDLLGILSLQKSNLSQAISEVELQKEGFVTVDHDLELLRKMNDPFPHIIAKENERVIGYTLVMLPDLKNTIEVLKPLFNQIVKIILDGRSLNSRRYFVMGQVCVQKEYRKRGVFRALYEELVLRMKNDFELIVTEVSNKNQRSLAAHLNIGFNTIREYHCSEGIHWHVVIRKI